MRGFLLLREGERGFRGARNQHVSVLACEIERDLADVPDSWSISSTNLSVFLIFVALPSCCKEEPTALLPDLLNSSLLDVSSLRLHDAGGKSNQRGGLSVGGGSQRAPGGQPHPVAQSPFNSQPSRRPAELFSIPDMGAAMQSDPQSSGRKAAADAFGSGSQRRVAGTLGRAA